MTETEHHTRAKAQLSRALAHFGGDDAQALHLLATISQDTPRENGYYTFQWSQKVVENWKAALDVLENGG